MDAGRAVQQLGGIPRRLNTGDRRRLLNPDLFRRDPIDFDGDFLELPLDLRIPGDRAVHLPIDVDAEQPFRFVAYSDNQRDDANPSKHYEVVHEGIIDFVTQQFGPDLAEELGFLMIPGDLVDDGLTYADWKGDLFDEAQDLISRIPVYPVLGNHEKNSPFFFKYFHLPANGSPNLLEHWWWLDHGNVRQFERFLNLCVRPALAKQGQDSFE